MGLIITIVVIVLIVLLVLFLVGSYNGLVKRRNRVDSAWSDIDVQLRRRYDLIPNLVETVKGYAAHESGTLEAVINARNAGVAAQDVQEQAQAENMLTGALRHLFAVSEAYPDLKANQNFQALQEELTGTEGRIAYARQYYNDAVRDYNTKIQSFPQVIFASMFGFKEREYFEIEDSAARGPVQVDFGAAPAGPGAPAGFQPPPGGMSDQPAAQAPAYPPQQGQPRQQPPQGQPQQQPPQQYPGQQPGQPGENQGPHDYPPQAPPSA